MKKNNRQSIVAATKATLGLTLFFTIGGMLFALLSILWILFFSSNSFGFAWFAFCVLLGTLGIFLGLYGYWNWKNLCFYQTLLEGKWLAGALIASLTVSGILWKTGAFYYLGALIPTIHRRDLWLSGNFIWMGIAALYLFNGWFLPFTVCIRRKANWYLTGSAAVCGSLAIILSVLCLGMIANPFKYYSLSASCDWKSPELRFPFAIECFAGTAFFFFAVASVCRVALYSRFSNLPFRPEILRTIKRGLWGWLIFLAISVGGSFFGNLFIQHQLHCLPECQQLENFRKTAPVESAVEWKHFQPLLSPILMLNFSSRLAGFKNEADLQKAETLIKQFPELMREADSLCASSNAISFYLDSKRENDNNRLLVQQLVRIARLQTLRLLIALEREEYIEAIRQWKLLQNLIMKQSNFVALMGSEYSTLFMEDYLNSAERLINTTAFPRKELRQLQQKLPEFLEQLEHCMDLTKLGIQVRHATALEQSMNSNRFGIHLKNWSWVVPGLWFVLNSNYYYVLKTPVSDFYNMEEQERLIQRGRALEQAINFLLKEPGPSQPPERTGSIQRNFLFFRNDGASSLTIENKKFKESRTYLQFGSDGNDIVLLKE